jgi:putative endonuclease
MNDVLYVYMLLCENGAYYTGYTTHIERRYQQHVNGTAKCKFTQSFKPIKLAQRWEIHGDKSVALKIEKFIKGLSKTEKEHIIQFPEELEKLFLNRHI